MHPIACPADPVVNLVCAVAEPSDTDTLTVALRTPTVAQPSEDQVSAAACTQRLPALELVCASESVSGRPHTGTVACPVGVAASRAVRSLVNAMPDAVAVPSGWNNPNQSSTFRGLVSAVTHA